MPHQSLFGANLMSSKIVDCLTSVMSIHEKADIQAILLGQKDPAADMIARKILSQV